MVAMCIFDSLCADVFRAVGRVEPEEFCYVFFFQAEDGIRDLTVTGVQTCALPISIMMVRMVEAISRGDGRSALTAASSAAREKKLAPSSPKKNTNRAANSRGKNPKKRATCSCNPTIPSTLTPIKMNPIHATQKTNRLSNSVEEGNAARFSSCAAPASSDSLSKRASRRMVRRIDFRM